MNADIYAIVENPTGKIRYIGRTKDLKARWRAHKKASRGSKQQKTIHRHMREVGVENFHPERLWTSEFAEVFAEERAIIKMMKDSCPGQLLNVSDGGMGGALTHSPETKARMSASKKGKTLTPEHRAKIGAAQKGKMISPECRAKLSAARTGKPLTSETKAKMSLALKGKPQTPVAIEARAAAMRGLKRSEEAKTSIRAAQQRRRARERAAEN